MLCIWSPFTGWFSVILANHGRVSLVDGGLAGCIHISKAPDSGAELNNEILEPDVEDSWAYQTQNLHTCITVS